MSEEKRYVNSFKLISGLDQKIMVLMGKDTFTEKEHEELQSLRDMRLSIGLSPAGQPIELQDWMKPYLGENND